MEKQRAKFINKIIVESCKGDCVLKKLRLAEFTVTNFAEIQTLIFFSNTGFWGH